jgi:hypothetical protein
MVHVFEGRRTPQRLQLRSPAIPGSDTFSTQKGIAASDFRRADWRSSATEGRKDGTDKSTLPLQGLFSIFYSSATFEEPSRDLLKRAS